MTVNELSKLYRVSRRSIIAELMRGRWDSHFVWCGKSCTGWVINNPPTIEPVMLPIDVARIMNVSTRLVQVWCASGKVKAFRIGKQWRIFYKDGLKLIENRKANLGSVIK